MSSLAASIASAFRWLLVNALNHRRGLRPPQLDFLGPQRNLYYGLAVEHNYRHFQFYANMIPATLFCAVANHVHEGRWRVFSPGLPADSESGPLADVAGLFTAFFVSGLRNSLSRRCTKQQPFAVASLPLKLRHEFDQIDPLRPTVLRQLDDIDPPILTLALADVRPRLVQSRYHFDLR